MCEICAFFGTQIHRNNVFFITTFPDNAASTTAAVAKKTEPMGGMASMLSSLQPGKDASRAGEEGEKWSPASSPSKPAAGKTLDPVSFHQCY